MSDLINMSFGSMVVFLLKWIGAAVVVLVIFEFTGRSLGFLVERLKK